MPRERNPNRDKALEIYQAHGGKITNREIAAILGEDEKVIAVWKGRDRWSNVVQQSKKRCTTKKKGGQPGNKNAIGNRGGSAPTGNKNAVTHGAYETIYLQALPEEERAIFDAIEETDRLDGEIRLLRLKLTRLLSREVIRTYDVFGIEHIRNITEEEREKGIRECISEIRKLVKTKKGIELAEAKAAGRGSEKEHEVAELLRGLVHDLNE